MLTDVNYMVPVYLVNTFWLLYNFLGAITAILVNFERKRYRTSERFMLHESVGFRLQEGNEIQAVLIDISLAGCAILLKDPLENADNHIGEKVSIVMSNGGLSVTGKILRSRSWGKKIIILFDDMPSAVYTRLINYIFDRQQSGYGSFNPGREDFSATFSEIISKWWKMVRAK
jgi:cellulose synthase (UDP-forming)